ncbi:MAG: YitT family protein [Marinifilaceae bacterium]|jgi:uncharacterized membrane-anchored protein YitT (DUF2179 family)|nr:YitT family protein [Marinifilaceae bacterium]
MAFVTKEKIFSREFFLTYAYLLGGCFVFALGAVLFAEPYKFAPGGTYGLSIVFHHLFGWRTELSALCMDIPLLLLGIYFLGSRFGIKTVICTFAIPGFMWLIHHSYGYEALIPNDALLSSIFGGIVYGVGIGMIFKSRATSGGSDIIAMILNKYTKISLGQLVIIVDSLITFSTVIAFDDWKLPMYSWIIIFIEGKVIDMIVEGPNINKTMLIVSDKVDLIKEKLSTDIKRGGTIFEGTGIYEGVERQVLYTVVTRREMAILRNYIAKVDKKAFVNVMDSNEILGEGFKSIDE